MFVFIPLRYYAILLLLLDRLLLFWLYDVPLSIVVTGLLFVVLHLLITLLADTFPLPVVPDLFHSHLEVLLLVGRYIVRYYHANCGWLNLCIWFPLRALLRNGEYYGILGADDALAFWPTVTVEFVLITLPLLYDAWYDHIYRCTFVRCRVRCLPRCSVTFVAAAIGTLVICCLYSCCYCYVVGEYLFVVRYSRLGTTVPPGAGVGAVLRTTIAGDLLFRDGLPVV